jgi:hypothetical protein
MLDLVTHLKRFDQLGCKSNKKFSLVSGMGIRCNFERLKLSSEIIGREN